MLFSLSYKKQARLRKMTGKTLGVDPHNTLKYIINSINIDLRN